MADKKEKGFKVLGTRKNKENGDYSHVANTVVVDKLSQPIAKNPGDNQIDELYIEVLPGAEVNMYVKNAYKLGLVSFEGKKIVKVSKNDKEGNKTMIDRPTNVYETEHFCVLQGTDGKLYLVIGEGKKAKGRMTEGWAVMSAFSRSLVAPKFYVDVTCPLIHVFDIDTTSVSFTPVQVDGKGNLVVSEIALAGYPLTENRTEEIRIKKEKVRKPATITSVVEENEELDEEDNF
jgi:hypothetical protein